MAHDSPNTVEPSNPVISGELGRILESTRQQVEEEFRKLLEVVARDAESAAIKQADAEREQALIDARVQLSAELRDQFDQTLRQTIEKMQADFDQRMGAATDEWNAEKSRLQEEMKVWRIYADAQREMGESRSQGEILAHFLDRAETFAPNLAVYVARADGLALWITRGSGPFPQVVSKSTIDPEAYFKPVVVKNKTVAAVCARKPIKTESLDFLTGALSRAIEAFGIRLQDQISKTASS
jgi:hypothetical protein